MAITNFEVYATRLRDERLDVKLKQTIAHELCESLEFIQLQDYSRFVSILWPVIRDLLLKTPPVFVSSAPEQKLRSTLLEIIQRIPHSEVFRPIVLEVVTTLVSLVKIENEDNAVVCLKIIYELHRMYRQLLESIAVPFLDLATDIYRNADQMLKTMDSADTPASLSTPNVNLLSPSAMSPGPDTGDVATKNLLKATSSFKVLTEIPIIVVSIIQANRRHADPFVNNILPLILHMLELNPKSSILQNDAANYNWRSAHADLITAQSKTLSFLAFFALGFTALLIPCQDRIARLTLQLLCLCPSEATATRKEMLIATRRIVSTEIRKAFVPLADKFLDMQVLVGSGLASQCILKPFAFSMLADLMHHIRSELSPSQLTRMVDFYAGCMHDQSLSSGVHTMCAKLLHYITECIMNIPDKKHSRVLLLSILKAFVSSFIAIGNQADTAISDIKSGCTHAEEKIYGSSELIRTNAFEQGDKLKELRFLLRSLVTGCKNVIYALRKCDSIFAVGLASNRSASANEGDASPSSNGVAKVKEASTMDVAGQSNTAGTSIVTSEEAEIAGFELDILTSLFREGLRACRIHDIERIKAEHMPAAADSSSADGLTDTTLAGSGTLSREAQIKLIDREGKEQIEHFANLFVSLDPAVFHELFTSQFDYAFQAMIEHCAAVSSVQVFVACDATSPAFISIMLRYLCDRLDLLGSDDEALTSTMLHLFKIAFLALAFFPEANEPVLQPYVQPIINSTLSTSKAAKKPENYFLLLRALFRSIGGGRYESLYKEVFPVLQSLLESLNAALGFTKRASPIQELFVEICLTVPVRLSVLLPYLSLLMKPLVFALESGPELVNQGLRTLELCIDNLTREFLDPILTPVIDEIMASLWIHLRLPSSASTHAPVAARILGKLGGRNRHMLLTRFPPATDEQIDINEEKFTVSFTFEGLPGLVDMPLIDAVVFSIKIMENRIATKQVDLARKDAVDFIVACARHVLALPSVAKGFVESASVEKPDYGSWLADLLSNPTAVKRLANISSPSSQGSQLLEQILGSCASIGDSCKAEALVTNGDAAVAMVSAATAVGATSLTGLSSNACATNGNGFPISHGSLMCVIWALSLASTQSDVARGLLHTIISIGAKQHIIQCVDAVQSEEQQSGGNDNANDDNTLLHATALADAVPEAISRVLVSKSDELRSTGCLMLKLYYSSLSESLQHSASLVGQLPAMRSIVSDLCAACYDPNAETKRSGCSGIAFIVKELNLGHTWLTDNLLELSKALLFTLKDTPTSIVCSTKAANSHETLLEIVKMAFPASIFVRNEDSTEAMDAEALDKDDVQMADSHEDNEIAAGLTDAKTDAEDDSAKMAGSFDRDPIQTEAVPFSTAESSSAIDSEIGKLSKESVPDLGGRRSDTKSLAGAPARDLVSDLIRQSSTEANFATKQESPKAGAENGALNGTNKVNGDGDDEAGKIAESNKILADSIDIDEASAGVQTITTDGVAATSEDDSTGVTRSPTNGDNESSEKTRAAFSLEFRAATQKALAEFQRLTSRLSIENSRLLKSFLVLIAKELANPSTEVREAAKACLSILVEVTGASVTVLLLPSRDRLLIPIFGKPLRALPHNMQIGNIDAITYCLSLDPPFLEINDELLRLLSEALALADAEDQALVNHPAQVRSNTISLTHLRHVCIRMLTAAMVRPEFSDAKNTPTRARIISVFFKSLYHKSKEVVDVANDGLKQVLLQQQKLPRDLLYTGLRPILFNLSDYKRLTVASLDGLARLLQLLTNYFKVEVGRKLLDHMQQWANPQFLQAASDKFIEDMHEIKILVAILQVFYLLPPTAVILLDDLVSSVVNLEVHLCRRRSSPFREPLFKFLNRYPTESVVYFVERIDSPHYVRVFAHAISSPECGPLREALISHTFLIVKMLKEFYSPSGEDVTMTVDSDGDNGDSAPKEAVADTRSINRAHRRLYNAMSALMLVRACLEYTPLWLADQNGLLQAMLATWNVANNTELAPSDSSRLARLILIEHLVHSLLLATRAMKCPPGILFQLLEIVGLSSEVIDVSFVFHYIWNELVVKWSIAKRREILSAFLVRLTDNTCSDDSNAILLRHLINPMVATVFTLPSIDLVDRAESKAEYSNDHSPITTSCNSNELSGTSNVLSLEQRGVELVRGQVISLIHQRVWAAHMSAGAQMSSATKASVRLELVQLSSILIRHATNAIADLRKDIIKFGWAFIRNDDIMIKNASYVLVAQFIAAFDTPPKIILQAYSSLLKAHHVESRFLVRQALDILLPVLPVRLGQPAYPPSTTSAAGGGGGAVSLSSPATSSTADPSSAGLPTWVLLAKRVLIDNSASLTHTTHVYQLIAAHPAIFFPYRMQFVSNLVGVLQKMCLTHSATPETRTLALDIMDLFLKWHDMLEGNDDMSNEQGGVNVLARSDAAQVGTSNGDDGTDTRDAVAKSTGTNIGTTGAPDLLMSEARRETIVGLLLRMLCLVFDFALKSNLGPRALDLLSRYLDVSKWLPMHLRLTFFERSIHQIEAQGMNQQLVLHILTVLSTVTAQMQPIWFEEYYGALVVLVRKCITVDNGQVQKIISKLLNQLYEQAADNEHLGNSTVVSDLKMHTEALISKNLQEGINIYGTLLMLHGIGGYAGEQFYSYIPLLMKYVQKYTKEHNTHAATAATATTAPALNSSSSSFQAPPSLQASSSNSSVVGLGSDSVGNATLRATSTSAQIISLVVANKPIPLDVEALVKGETPLDILLMLVILLRNHIAHLGDQRRSFLTYIIQLIERSSDPALLHVILAIVREWVLDPQDAFPTIKEKAMLMSSMMGFVHRSSAAADSSTSRASIRASLPSGPTTVSGNGASAVGGGSKTTGTGANMADADTSDPFSLLERRYLALVLEAYNDPRFTRSEMTMRLEQAFLSGMQSEDCEMRNRFLDTFDANMPPSLPVRLNYLLETQNWESVSTTFWLQQCLPLLLASAHQRASLHSYVINRIGSNAKPGKFKSTHMGSSSLSLDDSVDGSAMDVDADLSTIPMPDNDSSCYADHNGLCSPANKRWSEATPSAVVTVGDIIGPLSKMVLLDAQFAYRIWIALFPLFWRNLSSKDRHDLTSGIIRLLAKPYHQAQTSMRPNVIQAILEAFCMCIPTPRLPPQLLRYLGQTYSSWYSALTLLEKKILDKREIESAIFDRAMGVELGAFDALSELYTCLSASHYFYGAWKRHCQYRESHIALAYEQLDDWANAQATYERAQTKARAGVLPFSESEYCLWESRWVETTKRLQSWDMLLDLGLHESLPEIELEAGWRMWDWNERQTQVRQLLKATPSEFSASPRAKFYETYLTLIKGGTERTKTADFQRMCKEGIKTCLQRWNDLPPVGTPAHIEILHLFQLMVELGDASNIYASLASTKSDNLESKSGDLKSVLQTWRERLPNNSDPINIWSDLVAWRQHVFKAINDVYVPFISQQSATGVDENNSNDLSGDGSAKASTKNKNGTKGSDSKNSRKSGATAADGSDSSKMDADPSKASAAGASNGNGTSNAKSSVLTSYAYRGYHEMAWIINRFAHVARLHNLIDVCINSLTRIYTLPNIEIQEAFLKLREQAKCYYDRPQELQSGLDVISNTNLVYFAADQKAEFYTLKGQFLAKLDKLDEANHAFATGIQYDLGSTKAWAAWGRYNDERFCKNMPDTTGAVNAISCYMQAAGLAKRPRVRRYLARTLWLLTQDDANGNVCAAFDAYKSEMPTWYWIAFVPQLLAGLDAPYHRQAQQILLRIAKQYPQALYYDLRTAREESLIFRRRQALNVGQGSAQGAEITTTGSNSGPPATEAAPNTSSGQPASAIDELMPKLKTAHPLLALSMETMIDQIVHRLKPCPEEDIYRLVHALLSDGLQQLYVNVSQGKFDLALVDTIVSNTCRVGLSLPSGAIKSRFERDFGKVREMDVCEYVAKLYQWQQMLRHAIRSRPKKLMLSLFSPFLVEFEQQKFEDVEVPGQYLRLTDNSDDFVRIERFIPELSFVLRSSNVSRCLAIRGTDSNIFYFAVQHVTSRHNHQEERWVQLYRNLDVASEQERDTWEQHRLALHLPTIVSLAPHIRLVQEHSDSFTLQDVYDTACTRNSTAEIAPALYFASKMRSLISQLPDIEEANLALFEQICQQFVPSSLLSNDVRLHAASSMEYWLYRENFSYQISVSIALSYIIASAQRTPAKLIVSRTSANICLSDLVPTQATPGLIHNKEAVPFRLTPNIQEFVTEFGLEGIVPFAIHKVVQRIAKKEYLLRDFLDLYVRDELMHMPNVKTLASTNPQALAEMCERNVQLIVHRANQLVETLPTKDVQDKELSPMQPLMQLLMKAVAPSNLAKMDFIWMPWL
ncbi:transcription-associated protein 1 [Coemansia sp. RSA 1358]|uniref:Transcription-associated protein 1 n=1 Tax=Coemansia umbellata TaxID=1424467 RepID=A0ABQ8PWA2_9FUNG|nr:transcription-associated protein 1 [Coemansia umbellata]KAJ2623682.1 transcription-associated protein 1 [Coemansia sp. RSA 1358]